MWGVAKGVGSKAAPLFILPTESPPCLATPLGDPRTTKICRE